MVRQWWTSSRYSALGKSHRDVLSELDGAKIFSGPPPSNDRISAFADVFFRAA